MLDIDGTLCEIVEQPGGAAIPSHAAASLRVLNAIGSGGDVQIAFVTGRSIDDAQRMVGVDRPLIYGNHGMERLSATGNIRGPEGWEDEGLALREAARELVTLTRDFPGSRLEDKRFSLSLHYRGIDMTRFADLDARAREIANRWSLRLTDGKRVMNLVPRGAVNKGDAVLEIVHDTGAGSPDASILFVGDDVTDEDGFVALRDMLNAVTVRVGEANAESAARFSLGNPDQVHELLAMLAEARS